MTDTSEPDPRAAPVLPQAAPVAAPDAPVIDQVLAYYMRPSPIYRFASVRSPCTGLRMGRGLGLGIGGGLS